MRVKLVTVCGCVRVYETNSNRRDNEIRVPITPSEPYNKTSDEYYEYISSKKKEERVFVYAGLDEEGIYEYNEVYKPERIIRKYVSRRDPYSGINKYSDKKCHHVWLTQKGLTEVEPYCKLCGARK